MQRTQAEILARIEERKPEDYFGFEISDLIGYLDYEHAKPYLKEEVTPDQWDPNREPGDRQSILKRMLEYMPFAWEKANDMRGLSASRTMSHCMAWVWLLGDDEYFGDLTEYTNYGKDHLVKICEHYGWDSSQWDDGMRVNGELTTIGGE